jgi:hypothetical protein
MRRLATLVLLAMAFSLISVSPAAADDPDVMRVSLAVLTGSDEVPPGDLNGSGFSEIITVPSLNQLCYVIVVEDIILPAIAAHIHIGPPGVAGPILVPLQAPDAGGISGGCIDNVSPALLNNINQHPELYYVNVHTTDFPGGAVRGQLIFEG